MRLQVVFTPPARTLPDGTIASTDRGFTLEFVIDPAVGLDPAINALLAGDPFFGAQGLFALDLGQAGALSVSRESGAPLNDWLSFDAETLSFAGTPPPEFVGAVPVRIDVAGTAGFPAMSVITEVIVDDTVKVTNANGLSLRVTDERIDLVTPTDFNGTVVFNYKTTDEKGAVSDEPANIFFNVRPTRERPDAGTDALVVDEGFSVRFEVASLLANDFDRDGDAIRVIALGAPASGAVVLELAQAAIDPPAGLEAVEGAVFSAALADGSDLPTWLAIDAATGVISGEVPLEVLATLGISVTRDVAGVVDTATLSQAFDGNDGAFAVYTPETAFSGDDAFGYTITDDREGTRNGRVEVTVNPLEDPPVARADTVNAVEETPLLIDPATLLANDYDVDGDPIRFLDVANAQHGTVEFDGTNILFTPDHNFSGKASFEYTVTDDRHGVSTGKVTVNVASTNRAPELGADVFATQEDVPFIFTIDELMANDVDPDGDTLRFQSLQRSVEGGRIQELPGGRFQFVPDENVYGPITFRYSVTDGRKTSTQTVTFDVAAVNDAPIANDDFGFVTDMDVPVVIDFAALIANDRDVEGDSFEIVEVFDGDQGFVSRDGQTAIFTPDGGYFGDAGFHYRVTDEHGQSSVGYVNITVYPDFPLPVASSDTGLEMLEDGYIDIDPAVLMANDTAPEGSTLEFVTLQGAELLDNGMYRYTAEPNFFGKVTLRYAIQNEQGFPVWSTVTIDVLPVEDTPVARDDTFETTEDLPLVIFSDALLANDSDADPQALFITSYGETYGLTVEDLGNGQITITPDENFNGNAWFEYEMSDSTGRTDTARVHVWVEPENDPPVIDLVPIMRGLEDQAFNAALPSGFATDPDGDILTIDVRGKDGAALPAWLVYDAATRTLSGQPPQDFNGAVALEVAAFDGEFETVRELLVSIEAVNDAPEVGSGVDDVAGIEDQSFEMVLRSDAFTDVDGDALDLTLTMADGTAAPDWVKLEDGVLRGTPPANFNGTLALLVTASDGALTVSEGFSLNIAPVNDAPVVAVALGDAIFAEDNAISLVVPEGTFTDVDGDALVLSATLADGSDLPAWLSFDGTAFTGKPPQDFNGEFELLVTASDGEYSASSGFTLVIEAVNDAPAVLVPLGDLASAEDAPFSIALPTDGIGDVDGDALSFSVTMADGSELPAWLTFTGTHLEGTPPADFNGTLDLQLVASDGELSITDSFALAITAVNDAPVLLGALDALTGTEDETFAFTLPYDRFADIDGDPLVFTFSQADGSDVPAWLIFDAATGEVTGTPPADFNGSLDLVLTASDGEYSVNAPVRFTIDAVNDAPVLLVGLPDVVGTEDTALTFTIDTGTFGDVDGDALVLSATLVNGLALPEWLSFADGTFSAAPPQDYNGTLAITVSASDGEYSASDTFTLSFAAVNDPPVLQTPFIDLASDEDAPFDFTLDLGNFADVDGDTLTYSVLMADGSALPEWLQFEEGRLFGTPEQDFNGTLSLRITATDGEYIASDTFVLDILPVNDAPVLANWFAGTQHADEDAAIDIALPADAFTDVDGDALTLTAALANGEALPEWLAFDGTRFTGTPPQDFNGSFAIHVEATDGEYTASADFTLAIDPVNDAPVVLAPLGDVASAEDTAIDIAVPLDTFGDVDGDALTLTASLVGGAALPGWLTFDGTRLTGTPPQDFTGELDIEIMASDGALAVSDSFRLTVTPVNDAPVVLTPLADLVTAEDRAIDLPLPTSGFGDVDGDALTLSLTMADGSELPAWLSFDGARLTGTPPQDFNGVLSLTMTASDGELTVSDAFDLTILAVNDAPVVVTPLPNLSGTEDTAFVFAVDPASFADVDGDALTLSARLADGSGLPVWMRFDGTTLSGTPPQDFNGTLDIEVTANDGLLAASTVFTLAIDPVNDAPVLLAPLPDRTSAEDTAFSFTLPAGTFGDVDGDALTFTAALTGGDPLPGWLTFDGSVFAATPPQDFNGSLDITVTAGDGEYAAQGGFTLTVTPVNDAPVLIAGLSDRVFAEDTPVAFALETGKFADVDGDALSFTATLANGDPLPDWLAFDGTGFSGTPPQDYNGAFEVLVTASDGEYTVSDAFQLTIAPVNDAPVAAGTLADVTIYGRQTIDWQVPAGTFTDVDGDTLVLSATLADGSALPSWVSFDGTGFTGTVVDDFDGVVSFFVTASDGEYIC